jgi:hypothetical protein
MHQCNTFAHADGNRYPCPNRDRYCYFNAYTDRDPNCRLPQSYRTFR